MRNLLLNYWWFSLLLAAFFFIASYVYPEMDNNFVAPVVGKFARYISIAFVVLSAFLYFEHYKRKRLLASQTGLESIRQLSWRKFEDLITEAYKQNGYKIRREPVSGSDGGVDIVVEKEDRLTLVQCKQWRSRKLGVKIVREMFGILNASNADEVHIVTTGRITSEALSFAGAKPIKLIYGKELLNLIESAQGKTDKPESDTTGVKHCPECGSQMVLRKAKRGQNAGNQFWGCIEFPKCRYTVNV